jgi:hypothetical protein
LNLLLIRGSARLMRVLSSPVLPTKSQAQDSDADQLQQLFSWGAGQLGTIIAPPTGLFLETTPTPSEAIASLLRVHRANCCIQS